MELGEILDVIRNGQIYTSEGGKEVHVVRFHNGYDFAEIDQELLLNGVECLFKKIGMSYAGVDELSESDKLLFVLILEMFDIS